MCIGYPGQVTAIDADGATVRTEGVTRRASTLVLPDIRVGDWVTVVAGTIVDRLSVADAAWIERSIRAAQERTAEPGPGDPSSPHLPPNPARRP